jgi:hypothetical protein
MPTFAMSVCVLLLQDFAIQPRRPNLTILPHIFTGRRMNEEHHCNAQEHCRGVSRSCVALRAGCTLQSYSLRSGLHFGE